MNKSPFENFCIHPYYLKEKVIYIHPDDIIFFSECPHFFDISHFGSKKKRKPFQLGMIYGYDVCIQDDIQILLLAMIGGKNVED